jgi:putative transcriptional regulator
MAGGTANRLRDYRVRAKLTQQELADSVGAGRVTIARAENGRQEPTLDLARRLAAALGCGIDDLFGEGAPTAGAAAPPPKLIDLDDCRGRRCGLTAHYRGRPEATMGLYVVEYYDGDDDYGEIRLSLSADDTAALGDYCHAVAAEIRSGGADTETRT